MESRPISIAIEPSPASTGAVDTARLLGITIVAILPAVFWVTMLAFASQALGYPLSWLALSLTAAAISGFLASIYAAVSAAGNGVT